MSFIWGKSCRKCGKTATEGDYCKGCYECTFPVCNYCKKPMPDGEEKVGNCHKKPCYTNMTGKCCECNDRARKGCYCHRCYDSKYPSPPAVEYSKEGTNVNLKVRTDQKGFESAMYSLGQGAAHGLRQSDSLSHMLGLPSPWK